MHGVVFDFVFARRVQRDQSSAKAWIDPTLRTQPKPLNTCALWATMSAWRDHAATDQAQGVVQMAFAVVTWLP